MTTKLPSKFQINEKVDINYAGTGYIKNGFVVSIRFTESKVFYNIVIQTENDDLTLVEDVESQYVTEPMGVGVLSELI